MPLHRNATLDTRLAEQLSILTPAQKRELLDFATFLATRRQPVKSAKNPTYADLSGIIGIAAGGAGETDIAVNHDKYLYGDDPL